MAEEAGEEAEESAEESAEEAGEEEEAEAEEEAAEEEAEEEEAEEEEETEGDLFPPGSEEGKAVPGTGFRQAVNSPRHIRTASANAEAWNFFMAIPILSDGYFRQTKKPSAPGNGDERQAFRGTTRIRAYART